MSNNTQVQELEGSELGTIEYWEKAYELEYKNYENFGDHGEVWFSEESQFRVIKWMENFDKISKEDSIIDIGTGNGQMLIELAKEGYTNLTGVDYSPKAIDLAKKIATDQRLLINYVQTDMICDKDVETLGQYKICHDKGTYDAISLMRDNPKEKRNKYLKNVSKIVKDDGVFIITSCNWTESELTESLDEFFELHTIIPTPQFKFGGKIGSIVSCLVFSKKKK